LISRLETFNREAREKTKGKRKTAKDKIDRDIARLLNIGREKDTSRKLKVFFFSCKFCLNIFFCFVS
jgi:hypothetical protein